MLKAKSYHRHLTTLPYHWAQPMERSDSGQLLLVGVPGPELDLETANAFRQIQPGGFVLFGRNIRTPSQLRKLVGRSARPLRHRANCRH